MADLAEFPWIALLAYTSGKPSFSTTILEDFQVLVETKMIEL